jgi:hypothetical protein
MWICGLFPSGKYLLLLFILVVLSTRFKGLPSLGILVDSAAVSSKVRRVIRAGAVFRWREGKPQSQDNQVPQMKLSQRRLPFGCALAMVCLFAVKSGAGQNSGAVPNRVTRPPDENASPQYHQWLTPEQVL